MAQKQGKSGKGVSTPDPLSGLAELVGRAVEAIGEAQALQAEGRDREAISKLAPVGDQLQDALTLHRAAMILHGLR